MEVPLEEGFYEYAPQNNPECPRLVIKKDKLCYVAEDPRQGVKIAEFPDGTFFPVFTKTPYLQQPFIFAEDLKTTDPARHIDEVCKNQLGLQEAINLVVFLYNNSSPRLEYSRRAKESKLVQTCSQTQP